MVNTKTIIKSRKTCDGISLIELLIVLTVIGIIAAITIPSLLGSKRAVDQSLAVSEFSNIKTAQTNYKDNLNIGKFATLEQLRNTAPGGEILINPLLVNPDGTGRNFKGWVIEELESPTVSSFGVKLTPAGDNPADYSFFMYNDGVVRRTDRSGPWTRGTGTIVE